MRVNVKANRREAVKQANRKLRVMREQKNQFEVTLRRAAHATDHKHPRKVLVSQM